MRVALCLSGQPRGGMKSCKLIRKNIIEPNNCDVFMHMNFDNENRYIEKTHMDKGDCMSGIDIDKKLINFYKPLDVSVEGQKNFDNPRINIPEGRYQRSIDMNGDKFSREEHRDHTVKQMISMYYGIFKCNEMKETYSLKNGFVYDFVIRLRYDVFPRRKLILSDYESNFIHYQDMGHGDSLISDWMNFGSNKIMNVYSSIYLHMEYINSFEHFKKSEREPNTLEPSDICGGLYEHMTRDIMTLFKIQKRSFNLDLSIC
jgi:hypothetical protein